jgi:hypothetical protein
MEGKKIKIYFDDGEKVSSRMGTVTQQDDFFLTLDGRESIPKNRIVRIEVIDKNGR